MYVWRAFTFEEAQAVIALLWMYLGPIKRAQAAAAMRLVQDQYTSGRYRARRGRRALDLHELHTTTGTVLRSRDQIERAWAAGFLDAEGYFGCFASVPRKKGPTWFRVRVSADQVGKPNVPSPVLIRLQAALGGIGRIERHSGANAFKWLVEGAPRVRHVLALTHPWLGAIKRQQAEKALSVFEAQARLKGDSLRCVRGHEYDIFAMRGGRFRRLCSICARINRTQTSEAAASALTMR
jgi:hypothetical protein